MPYNGNDHQSGNIFFTLFGAIALVGVIGAATTTLIRGPLSTVSAVNMKAKVDTQLAIASKLATIAAAQMPNGGNCDYGSGDTYIEPLHPVTGSPAPVGGGQLPGSVGAAQVDPWGTPLGYCVWDLGAAPAQVGDPLCAEGAGEVAYLDGGHDSTQPVFVVLSAGPDRAFQTSCEDWADNVGAVGPPSNASTLVNKPASSDDIIAALSYQEAQNAADGLWSITAGDPNTITTDKNVAFSSGSVQFASGTTATFQGTAQFAANSKLDLGFAAGQAGLFLLPDDTELLDAECTVANNGVLRINVTDFAPNTVLEMCDSSMPGAFQQLGGAGVTVSNLDDLGDAAAGGDYLFLGAGAGLAYDSGSGSNNLGVGINAAATLVSGSDNIVIGNGARTFGAGTTDSIVIGHGIVGSGNNTLQIGGFITGSGIYTSAGTLDISGSVEANLFRFDSNLYIDDSAGGMVLATGGTPRVTVDGSGNVSIASSGGVELTVNGDANVIGDTESDQFIATGGGAAGTPGFTFDGYTSSGLFYNSGAGLGFTIGGTSEMELDAGGLRVHGIGVFDDYGTFAGYVQGDNFQFNGSTNSGLFFTSGTGMGLNYGGTNRVFIGTGGYVGISNTNPQVELDVSGAIRPAATTATCSGGSIYGAIRYASGDKLEMCSSLADDWVSIGTSGGGGGGTGSLWTNNTTYITRGSANMINTGVTLPAGLTGAGSRMLWYPDKSAFRAGEVNGNNWDDSNIGARSVAFGQNTVASGVTSFAAGFGSTASGDQSTVLGGGNTASGNYSTAIGNSNTASNWNAFVAGTSSTASGQESVALGHKVTTSGQYSFGFGLGNTAGVNPSVSATRSLGIFMGDQGGVNLNTSNVMLLAGGSLVIDPDTTSATNIAPSRAGLNIDVEGDVGAIQYCDEDGNNCFTAASVASGSVGVPGFDREIIYNSNGTLWTTPGFVFSSTGFLGIGNASPEAALDIGGTGAILLPRGVTGDRPVGINGMLRYNSASGKFEGYQGGGWYDIITNGGGGLGIDDLNDAIAFYASGNMHFGQGSGDNLTTGSANTSVGVNAMSVVTSGIGNSGFGAGTLQAATGGNYNTALGYSALNAVNSGIGNIGIGAGAGDQITTGSNNIIIGYGQDAANNTGSNQLNIGGVLTGDMTIGNMAFNGTAALRLPGGTTAERPASGENGMLRYNSQTGKFEAYQAGAWEDIITGAAITSFLSLTDTPASYAGASKQFLRVNTAENAVEFTDELFETVSAGAAPFADFDDLDDVVLPTPSDGDVVSYDSASGTWINTPIASLVAGAAAPDRAVQFNSGGSFTGSGNLVFTSASILDLNGALRLSGAGTDSFITPGAVPASVPTKINIPVYDPGNFGQIIAMGLPSTAPASARALSMLDARAAAHQPTIGVFSVDETDLVGFSWEGSSSDAYIKTMAGNIRFRVGNNDLMTLGATTGSIDMHGTGALTLPVGSTAQRPAVVENGMIRYNSQSGKFEGYQGGLWQDILTSAVAGGASAPDRGIQFNSGGNFTASSNLVYAADGDLLLTGTYTGTQSAPASGAGTRMFFDTQSGAFRAGVVPGTEWDVPGVYSVAMGHQTTANAWSVAMGRYTRATGNHSTTMGYNTQAMGTSSLAIGDFLIASGHYSTAFGRSVVAGNGTAGSGFGDGSMALGLIDDAVTITTRSQVQGIQSYGIFMGDQDGLVMTANNTMGLFGGKMVIDPAVPATQLTARGVLDLGAATDALVLPRGTTAQRPGTGANGMIRYNSQTGKFEGYQAGSWQDIMTGNVQTTFTALTDTPASYAGSGNMFVRVNTAENALEFTDEIIETVSGQPDPVYMNLGDLGDVDLTVAPTDGQILQYDSASGTWQAASGGSIAMAIDDLTDAETDYTGDFNMWMGQGAGAGIQGGGQYNIAVGQSAGANITTGDYNNAFGQSALNDSTTANANNAFGYRALGNATGQYNQAFGHLAMDGQPGSTGGNNVAMGSQAMYSLLGGNNNVAIGHGTLYATADGNNNTAVGREALASNVGKHENTAIGAYAMFYADDTASTVVGYNTAVGAYALQGGATAASNTGVGNTAIGHSAMMDQTSGNYGTAVGAGAMANNTTGMENTAIGQNALRDNVTGNYSVAVGSNALLLSTGGFNTAFGRNAGNSITTGTGNILIGHDVDTPTAATNNYLNIGGVLIGDIATGNLSIAGTAALTLPRGATADRPVTGVNGMLRYNSQSGKFEGYQSGAWQDLLTGAATSSFVSLTDTPASYAGSGTMFVRVNTAENALEFTDAIVESVTGQPAPEYLALNDLSDVDLTIAPTQGQALVYDSGSGVWVAATVGGVPGGADMHVQFNSGGGFGGSADFTWDDATSTLALGGPVNMTHTSALTLPRGTTAQRPAGANGMLRYNSQSGKFEGYQAGSWQDIVTGSAIATFVSLTDTPATYAGSAGKFTRVNAGATALEFSDEFIETVTGQPVPASSNLDDLGDVDLTVAPADGEVLKYDSASGLWIAGTAGGVPGGADTYVQFNLGGVFGGSANFTWDNVNSILSLGGTAAMTLPRGTTAQRPGTGVNGMLRYNSQSGKFEGYQAGSWQDIVTGSAVSTFLSLTDSPASYAGAAGQFVKVNAGATALEFSNTLVNTFTGQPAPTGLLLDDIDDVDLTVAPTDGQVLQYDSAAGMWLAGNSAAPLLELDDLTDVIVSYSSSSMYLGTGSGDNITTGSSNTSLGHNALAAVTTGSNNVAIGVGSGASITTATDTIAIGNNALGDLSLAGASHIAIGTNALGIFTGGGSNLAIGYNASAAAFTTDATLAIGAYALEKNQNHKNLCVGERCFKENVWGTENVGLGGTAGQNSTGSNNTIIGYAAMQTFNAGDDNTALGHLAGFNLTSGSNNIAVGSNINFSSASGSYQLNIGDAITGDMQTGNLSINGTAALRVPSGTTAQRPAGANGMLRYNSQSGKFEGYQAGSWQDIVTGSAVSTFLSLTDTPASYAGSGGMFVKVNAGATAVEFTDSVVNTVSGQPAPTGLLLDDLGDVDLTVAPTDGQVLKYDSGAGMWIAASGGAASGADRSIQFNSGGSFAGDANLVYTSAGYLGLGLSSPDVMLDIAGEARIGNTALACAGTVTGALRYNSGTTRLEMCDGATWRALVADTLVIDIVVTPSTVNNMDVTGCGTPPCNGTPVVFTVQNQGASTSAVMTTSVSNATNFVITSDTCNGNTLGAGLSCQVEVTPRSSGNESFTGLLNIAANNNPFSIMQGTSSGFGCSPGVVGAGGVYVACGLNDGDGAYDLVAMPSGCDGTTLNPTCSGNDGAAVLKTWGAGVLIPSNCAGGNFACKNAQNAVNIIAAKNAGAGAFPAAEYCDAMNYSGKNDWYLPNQYELQTLIYSEKNAGNLTGFVNSAYWTSYESNGYPQTHATYVNMTNASIDSDVKSTSFYTRCVRRENLPLPAASTDTNPADSATGFGSRITETSGQRLTSSGTVTVSHILQPISVSVAGASGTPRLIINGGAEIASGTAYWGDVIAVVMDAPTTAGNTNTATITLGTDNYTYKVGYADPTKESRIFVTDADWDGNLGGLGGADTKCTNAANAAAIGGTWVALLSDSGTSAIDRLPWNWGTLKRLDGTVVADSWNDLWDGNVQNAVNVTENMTTEGKSVWTATNTSGAQGSPSCINWNSNYGGDTAPFAFFGTSAATGGTWINNSTFFNCASTAALYCVESVAGGLPPGSPAIGLDDLSDVDLTTTPPGDGETLVYNSASGLWLPGAASGAGTPGGADTQVQFNSGGSFGGSADFTWDNVNSILTLGGTSAIILPRGITAERPATGVNGMLRYNSQTGKFEGYQGGTWTDIVTGAVSGVTFLSLTDSPASYAGAGGQFVKVNAGATALEFTDTLVNTVAGVTAPTGLMLDNIGDVDLSVAPTDGQALVYDSASGDWVAGDGIGSVQTFLDLTDTPATYAGSGGMFMKINAGATGVEFVNNLVNTVSGAAAPTGMVFDDLDDVVITAVASGDFVVHNGTNWVNPDNISWNGTTFAVTGNITYTGTLVDTSDMRLKTDIHPLREYFAASVIASDSEAIQSGQNGLPRRLTPPRNDGTSATPILDRLGQVETYSFRMKDNAEGGVEFGVMAQEINKIFPELVVIDDSTAEQYMAVNYVGLIAPLIEASKELKAENDNLKTELATMQTAMADIQGDIKGLKAHTGYGINKASIGFGMMIGMIAAFLSGVAFLSVSALRRQRRQAAGQHTSIE